MKKRIDAAKASEIGQLCACYNLRRTSRIITNMYDEILRPSGIRVTQFTLMMALSAMEPVTVKRLARAVAMDRTTMGRNLKPLESRQLIEITPGEDRRERIVQITPKGQDLMSRTLPLWENAQQKVIDSMGQIGLISLLDSLNEVAAVPVPD